jgi:hypothetical protein
MLLILGPLPKVGFKKLKIQILCKDIKIPKFGIYHFKDLIICSLLFGKTIFLITWVHRGFSSVALCVLCGETLFLNHRGHRGAQRVFSVALRVLCGETLFFIPQRAQRFSVALRVLRGKTLFFIPQRAQRCTEFFPPWLSVFSVVKLYFFKPQRAQRCTEGFPLWLSVFSEVILFFLYHRGHRGAQRFFSMALRVLCGERITKSISLCRLLTLQH